MKEYDVWTPTKLKNVPAEAKSLTYTWDMKKISSGVNRAGLYDRGYNPVDGVHYDSANIPSPVTNDMII